MKHKTTLAHGTSLKEMRHLFDDLTFARLHRVKDLDVDGDDISEQQLVYLNTLNVFAIQCAIIPIASEYYLHETEERTEIVLRPYVWLDSRQNPVVYHDRHLRHTPLRDLPRLLNPVRQELLVLQAEDLRNDTRTATEPLNAQRLSLLTYAAHET